MTEAASSCRNLTQCWWAGDSLRGDLRTGIAPFRPVADAFEGGARNGTGTILSAITLRRALGRERSIRLKAREDKRSGTRSMQSQLRRIQRGRVHDRSQVDRCLTCTQCRTSVQVRDQVRECRFRGVRLRDIPAAMRRAARRLSTQGEGRVDPRTGTQRADLRRPASSLRCTASAAHPCQPRQTFGLEPREPEGTLAHRPVTRPGRRKSDLLLRTVSGDASHRSPAGRTLRPLGPCGNVESFSATAAERAEPHVRALLASVDLASSKKECESATSSEDRSKYSAFIDDRAG